MRRFESSVAEALAAQEGADQREQAAAAEFASSRIDRMPVHFRFAIRVIGAALLLESSAREGTLYWSLEPRRRAAAVENWDHKRLAPLRLYAKTLRSFVLLSVYERRIGPARR